MPKKVPAADIRHFLDAWFEVRQFIQASNFNRFQGAGLSATQFMTLNLLPESGDGVAMGELARRMNLKPATVAQTVDSLQARDLLERVRGESDKRQVLVRLTPSGAELQNAASEQFKAQIGELLAALLPEERAGLITGLEALVRAAARKRLDRNGRASSHSHGACLPARSGPPTPRR